MTNALYKWFKVPSLADRLRARGVREDLCQAVDRTPFGRQGDLGLADLPQYLTDDEAVVQLFEGRSAGQDGLLLLTSGRLVFVPNHRGPASVIELSDVLAVNSRTKRGLSTLEVISPAGTTVVDRVLGNQADSMAENIRRALAPPPPSATAWDPLAQLAELRALHQAGAITDSEFQVRKAQLFGQI